MRQAPVLCMDCGDNSGLSSTPCMHAQGTVQAVLRSRRSASDQASMRSEQWATLGFAAGACLTASGMRVHAQATPRALWGSRHCASYQGTMWLQHGPAGYLVSGMRPTVSGVCVHAQATRRAFWSSRRCAPWQAGM